MRRQRRKRSTRRRGLQHIGDVLSQIVTDVEQMEAEAEPSTSENLVAAAPALEGQNTFAFYQTSEV